MYPLLEILKSVLNIEKLIKNFPFFYVRFKILKHIIDLKKENRNNPFNNQ